MNTSLYRAAENIASLISALHQKKLPDELLTYIRSEFAFDDALILAYMNEAPPISLHQSYKSYKTEQLLPEYLQKAYLLDPVYNAYLKGIDNGLYRLKDIAPDRFHNTAYFREYYNRTSFNDEVICLTRTNTGYTIALSLFKQGLKVSGYSKAQLNKLHAISPVICATLAQHWNNFTANESDNAEAHLSLSNRIKRAIFDSEEVELTERQAEIIALTLRGHSATSIGLNLGISGETVKVHRRNIYNRLRISSQNQLFSMVIGATGPLTSG